MTIPATPPPVPRPVPEQPAASVPEGTVRASVPLPVETSSGTVTARMLSFTGLHDGREHIALVFGGALAAVPLVRVHSECLTGDVFGSGRCDCGPQLREALDVLAEEGGVLLYLRQEGRGIGLYNKLDAYLLQDRGMDTFQANRELDFVDDPRDYRVAAQMLKGLGVASIRLLTNNPEKSRQLMDNGIAVDDIVGTGVFVRDSNTRYLQAKIRHAGHLIALPVPARG
ncbi:GTP cyclohydrolase II [Streptomyces sp. NPDC056909]|uniref:GTP cyclohydrolase II n=1 Tax=Streptomyces sp. NPDC056909 TaxID=3345963 RepID=UPI003677379F